MLLPTLILGLLSVARQHRVLYTLDHDSLSPADQVLAQTLQGIVGKKEPGIWLKTSGVQAILLENLKKQGWDIQPAKDVWSLVDIFHDQLNGMITYKLGTESLNVATGFCGPMHSVAVDVSQIQSAANHGLRTIMDGRAFTEQRAFELYRTMYADGFVVEQSVDKPGALRDFAVMHDAFVMDTRDHAFRKKVIAASGPNPHVFGWGPDEYGWISDISAAGGTGVAADWCINLSVLEKLKAGRLRPPTWKPVEREDNVRYVAFVLSDGDNVQWQTGGFVTDPKFYGSALRGQVPMSWEVSPLLAEFAPTVLQEIYTTAKPTDDFVTGAGLPGYVYPHAHPDRVAVAKQTEPFMHESGLKIASILNQNDGTLEETFPWLDLPDVDAVIYKDYSPYNRRHGEVAWHKGKPSIAYRFVLWENLLGIDELVADIGKMPTQPKQSSDSYALVNVHAWSYGSIGGPIEAVRRVIEKLPPNTRVVTANQLIEILQRNHLTWTK